MTLPWLFNAPSGDDPGGDSVRPRRGAHPVPPKELWPSADAAVDNRVPTSAERTLADQLRTGDVAAFRLLFDRYYAELVAHAYRYVQQQAVAEELVQDAFGHMWERRALLPDALNPRAYLYAMVRHAALKVVRREVLEARVRVEPTEHAGSALPDVLAALDREDTIAALDHAVAALPARLRTVVELRWGRQLRVAEVAAMLGVTPKAVETYITRAVKALRTTLSPGKGPDE